MGAAPEQPAAAPAAPVPTGASAASSSTSTAQSGTTASNTMSADDVARLEAKQRADIAQRNATLVNANAVAAASAATTAPNSDAKAAPEKVLDKEALLALEKKRIEAARGYSEGKKNEKKGSSFLIRISFLFY